MEDGALHVIALNEIREEQRTFRDMSWKEYDELWKRRKDTSRSLEAYDLEQQVAVQRDMADVITTAKKLQNSGKNRKKNIREHFKYLFGCFRCLIFHLFRNVLFFRFRLLLKDIRIRQSGHDILSAYRKALRKRILELSVFLFLFSGLPNIFLSVFPGILQLFRRCDDKIFWCVECRKDGKNHEIC